MTEELLHYIYFANLGLIALNSILIAFKRFKFVNLLGLIILILALGSYFGVYLYSGHLPVYSKFATLQNIVLIVVLLGLFFNYKRLNQKDNINVFWYVALFFQAYIITQGFEINDNYYMYDKFYVIGFFQFRILSISLFVFSIVNYIAALRLKQEPSIQTALIHRARNFTLLGAGVYLVSEFSGSYWCYLWWGDPWHWSKGFFLASIMFLLSMLSGHLPQKYLRFVQVKILLSLLPLALIVLIYLIYH
ncbi:MAG: hypothetical protein JEZ09_10920 [Salinivirgaceae bacterium]|nr:hypothetical protein [Salinivirgaceae bacterium]